MVTSGFCEGYTNDAVDDIDDHAGDHAGQALPIDPPRQQAFVEACVCMRFHRGVRHQDTRSIATFMLLLCLSGVIALVLWVL